MTDCPTDHANAADRDDLETDWRHCPDCGQFVPPKETP